MIDLHNKQYARYSADSTYNYNIDDYDESKAYLSAQIIS